MNIKLEAITYEEHLAELKAEVTKKGLYKAVNKRCDVINSEASILLYIPHAIIQESLSDILELIQMTGEEKQDEPDRQSKGDRGTYEASGDRT